MKSSLLGPLLHTVITGCLTRQPLDQSTRNFERINAESNPLFSFSMGAIVGIGGIGVAILTDCNIIIFCDIDRKRSLSAKLKRFMFV